MDRDIARPDGFFRLIHPNSSRGKVVLERKYTRGLCYSQVTPRDAAKIARLSYKVPDLHFSVSSFSGMPLLTNFENVCCLYVQLPCSDGVQRRLYNLVEDEGFTLPSAVITDSTRVSFFWVLKKPVTRVGFHKVYLMQHGLYELVGGLNPYRESLNIGSLIPLIGSTDSRTGGYVSLMSYTGQLVENQFAENFLMRRFGIHDLEQLKRHARGVQELLALLQDRVLIGDADGEVEDWLVSFGASLCHFCTKQQLIRELQAIAVSLKGKKWNQIKNQYGPLVDRLAETAIRGYVDNGGIPYSLDKDDWFTLVAGKLKVTQDEINRLRLSVLTGDDDDVFSLDVANIEAVGEIDFVPLERLLLKEVA